MNSIIPSIMQSIKPQYCELIAAGRKTIEVRKTKPKLKPPFKVYIYCTKDKWALVRDKNANNRYMYDDWKWLKVFPSCEITILGGKVIGEYVCDEVIKFYPNIKLKELTLEYIQFVKNSCVSMMDLLTYSSSKRNPLCSKGRPLCGYHITNLKIYDEPKELSKFYHYCGDNPNCKGCQFLYVESNEDVGTYEECQSKEEGWKPLTRPPQSWCYVAEVS